MTDSPRRIGLRARHPRRAPPQQALETSPEAEATVAVGLKPQVLTKQERAMFGGRTGEYLAAR